ncbi:hypothetical protein [Streptomyces sp. NPDC096339]|uniref:hypothetical protein n=1 Tax=Streptomyces sp. NPDC096339 TaxID=3366086 RepID=UPI0037F33625
MKRTLVSTVLAGSLAGSLMLSFAPGAQASATSQVPAAAASSAAPQEVDIPVTPDGFTAPSVLRAGPVTLRVRSTDPRGAWIGLVRLRPGVPLERYLEDLERAMGDDPVEGGKAVARDAEMLGGAAVAHAPAAVTMKLTPGEYHLIDFRDVGLPDLADRVRPVRALAGHPRTDTADIRPAARITLRDGAFEAPDVLSGPVQVVNRSRQHNEAMLMPVRPGTTLADLDAFFADVDAGRRPSGSPFTGGPTGVVPLSPGRSAVLTTDLPPGEYALVTWVRDLRTGSMFAARGMRMLITVQG